MLVEKSFVVAEVGKHSCVYHLLSVEIVLIAIGCDLLGRLVLLCSGS
jgi:hypothetical protein